MTGPASRPITISNDAVSAQPDQSLASSLPGTTGGQERRARTLSSSSQPRPTIEAVGDRHALSGPSRRRPDHPARRRVGAGRRARVRRALVAFRVDGRDVLRPASDDSAPQRRGLRIRRFPLLPYSGPIFGGGFRFRGQWHPLARNVSAEPRQLTARAGSGRGASRLPTTARWNWPWTTCPRPTHFPSPGGRNCVWPCRPVGSSVGLELVNRDHRPMPAGLGLHPYFPKAAGTMLRFDCTGVWPPDAPEAVAQAAGRSSRPRFPRGPRRRPARPRSLLRGLGRDRDVDRAGRLRHADRGGCGLRQAAGLQRLGLSLYLRRAGDQRQ